MNTDNVQVGHSFQDPVLLHEGEDNFIDLASEIDSTIDLSQETSSSDTSFECPLCNEKSTDTKTCSEGHAICSGCLKRYIDVKKIHYLLGIPCCSYSYCKGQFDPVSVLSLHQACM